MRWIARLTAGLVPLFMSGVFLASGIEAQGPRRPVGIEPLPPVDESRSEDFDVPADTPATLDGGATLNRVLLRPIRDETLGLDHHDRPAYFYGLWLCQQIDSQSLAQLAAAFRAERQAADPQHAKKPPEEFPTFADVFQHPQDYRGRPVTLQGSLRRLVEHSPGPNDLGIDNVYEGWFYTEDSQNHPGLVVFTRKPAGLPLGSDLSGQIQFTGYFLKQYGYNAQDTLRKAPLFLAGEVQWIPGRAVVSEVQATAPPLAYVVVTIVVFFAAWGIWRASRNRESPLARYNVPGRNFDQFPPQEFLESVGHPVEPHH